MSGRPRPWRVEDREALLHQHVVVGLVARGAAQLRDAGALGDVDPDLGDQHALEVETGDLARRSSRRRAARRAKAAADRRFLSHRRPGARAIAPAPRLPRANAGSVPCAGCRSPGSAAPLLGLLAALAAGALACGSGRRRRRPRRPSRRRSRSRLLRSSPSSCATRATFSGQLDAEYSVELQGRDRAASSSRSTSRRASTVEKGAVLFRLRDDEQRRACARPGANRDLARERLGAHPAAA